MKGSYVDRLFHEEPARTFAQGHVFKNAPDLVGAEHDPSAGYWRCDVADDDRLIWTEKVYELFGIPNGSPVERDWAVSRYSGPSKSSLELVRMYALNRKLGFILDAEICPEEGENRWIRILAVPIMAEGSGRVAALHGLKRLLYPIDERSNEGWLPELDSNQRPLD